LFLAVYSPRLKALYVIYLVFAALAYIIIDRQFYQRFWFWLVILGLLLPRLYTNILFVGNHYFVMVYIVMLFAIITAYKSNSEEVLAHNAKVILILIMSFAVLQKLLTPDYLNGNSIAFLAYTGNALKYVFYFFTENKSIFQENASKMAELHQYSIEENPRIQLQPIFKSFPQLIIWFSYLTLIGEILFIVALFIKKQWLKHGFIVLFLLSVFVTREETGFLSILTILMLMQVGKQDNYYRAIYLSVFIFFLSTIIVGVGEL
jgi:hypothetical protein